MKTLLILVAILLVAWAFFRRRDEDDADPDVDAPRQDFAPSDDADPDDVGAPEPSPPVFQLGRNYSRAEIHDVVGGGVQDYLPHVDGRVVCGCFNPELNPDAPDVVLPGRGPRIEKWAEVFGAQTNAVPCFLKRGANAWEYVGDYRVVKLSRARREIEPHALAAGRIDVSMVLFLVEQLA